MNISHLVDRFNFVPSFLDLDIASVSMEKLKHTYTKSEESEDYEGECANVNLSSFLSFLIEGPEKSSEYNTIALERNPRNIQANVIKSIILFSRGETSEAERSLEHLKLLIEDDFLITESKAEIAEAYTRIDADFNKLAIGQYEEIVQKYPDNFFWKYRLALTIRRTLHPTLMKVWPLEVQWDKYNLAKNLFEDIVARCPQVEIKSLSYIGLATLIYGPCTRKEFLLKLGFRGDQALTRALEYLDKANEASEDSQKVLTETGRLLRSMKQYKAAIEILKRAYDIRQTSMNCHQLGLAVQHVDHMSFSSMEYLKKAVELSDGLNLAAVFDLGRLYLQPSNSMLDKARECFEVLIDSPIYNWKKYGYEYLSKCYKAMQYNSFPAKQKRECLNKLRKCQSESIINAILDYQKATPITKREKVSPGKLFSTSGTRYNFYSTHDQAMRMVCYYKQSLSHYDEIQKILRSADVHKGLKDLVMRLFRDEMYEDCLDMLPIMMMTSIEDIEKFAMEVMLDIVEKVGDRTNISRHGSAKVDIKHGSLLETCFIRMKDCFLSDELDSDVRLIYEKETCQQEVGMIEELLLKVGLTVKKNDEGVLPFTKRKDSLSTVLSSTIAVVCIFKENNIDLLNDYPIDNLPRDQPTILYITINNSNIAPILQTQESITCPEFGNNHLSKGKWLKDFGQKIFYPVLNN